jgi:hypothetical protein
MNACRRNRVLVPFAFAVAFALAVLPGIARADAVTVPLTQLGYPDGVTVAGVAPSVTFDLPRYASLRAARLELEAHVSPNADPASTITVAVDGQPIIVRSVRTLAKNDRLVVPLPIPAPNARTFAITVSGALRVAGDPCAADTSRRLFLRIGRDSAIVLQTATGGGAEAFFRDYRGTIDVVGALDDPAIAGAPYRLDRLEPWHRVSTDLVAHPLPGHRTIVFTTRGPVARAGDVLRITPAAFAALPEPLGQSPQRRDGRITFGELRQNLGTATGVGDLAFDVPLAASIVGGVPQGLRAHVAVAHSALAPAVGGTLRVVVNGVLVGARVLDRGATTQTIDVAVPASVVGPSNDLRVLVATEVAPAACASATNAVTATLLGTSSFNWSGVEPRAATIESFLTALHGRVIVLVAPGFARAAFHVMTQLGALNAAIDQLDVVPFTGSVPSGYDAALVFGPPAALGNLGLAIRTGAPAFDVIDPAEGVSVLHAAPATTFALLQLGEVHGTPLLALSYHGGPAAIASIASLKAGQLATQVAPVAVLDDRGATAFDIGDKLRVRYAGDATIDDLWARVRIGVAVVLTTLIVGGAAYASRRLTGGSMR